MIKKDQIEFPRLRILDFYFSFPRFVADVRFPRTKGATKLKKSSLTFPVPYEIMPDKRRLFSEIGDFQIQAINILRAKEILKETGLGIIEFDSQYCNAGINGLLVDSRYLENEFFVDLVNIMEEITMLGKDGLKSRTGLMEYRYDAV